LGGLKVWVLIVVLGYDVVERGIGYAILYEKDESVWILVECNLLGYCGGRIGVLGEGYRGKLLTGRKDYGAKS
jgi:hypothetical protein